MDHNLYGPQLTWATTYMGYNLCGAQLIRATTYTGHNLYGPQLIRATTYVGHNIYGPSLYGPQLMWVTTYMDPAYMGHNLNERIAIYTQFSETLFSSLSMHSYQVIFHLIKIFDCCSQLCLVCIVSIRAQFCTRS